MVLKRLTLCVRFLLFKRIINSVRYKKIILNWKIKKNKYSGRGSESEYNSVRLNFRISIDIFRTLFGLNNLSQFSTLESNVKKKMNNKKHIMVKPNR